MDQNPQTPELYSEQQVHPQPTGLIHPDVNMLLLTWITFFSLLLVLYKFAWKPILLALSKREKLIQQSIEDAERIKQELAQLNEKSRQILEESHKQANEIIERSRMAATEAGKIIEQKTKEEAQILLDNAQRQIRTETEKAITTLRQESIRIACGLAEKILQEKLDDEKSRNLIDRLILKI